MTEFELECWARDLEEKAERDKGLSLDDAHRLDEIRHTLAAMNGLRFWPYRYTREPFRYTREFAQPSVLWPSPIRLAYRSLVDVEEARRGTESPDTEVL
jgi:hypothetical protein